MANNDKLLVSNEWKHTLETTPTKSLNSLVSLYDLFYNEEGTLWVQSGNDSTNIGTKLDHDIICLNRSMLTATNSIDTSSAAMSANTWWTYGIDVSIPKYDSRSKYRTFTNRAQIKQQATAKNLFKTNSYNIYDKEAALAPSNITIFSKNGVLTGDMASSLEWTTYTPPSIGVWDGNSDLSGMTEDIILAAPDVAFRSTLVTQSNLSAYNKIFINPYTSFGIALIVKALGIDPTIIGVQAGVFQGLTSSNIQEGLLDNSHPLSALWEPMPKRGINSLVASINFNGYATDVSSDFDGNGSAEFDQNRFKNILKETYVWVRAPFFADYIVTESFGQDLNTTAKVKHSELMLSGAGDFKKYDAYLTGKSTRLSLDSDPSSADNNVTANASLTGIGFNDANNIESGLTDGSVDQEDIDKLSENTLPYIPKTSPTVDFYTAAFVSEKLERAAKGADDLNYSPAIKDSPEARNNIDSYLDKDDSSIRGLPIAAINRNDSTKTTVVPNLVPPNYYDPESRYTSEEYEKMGRFPTVIPSDGNLFVDGRIIGPSMDELWYVIKKMLGGRLSDNLTVSENVSENANIQRAVNFDLAIPYGNAANIHNDKDTSLSEVPVSEFNFDYGSENKHGDPVGYKFVKDTTEGVMNETVVVNKFINQNDAIVYPIYKSLKSLSDKVVTFDTTTAKDRDIKNFTAWKDDGVTVVKDNETVLEGMWAPREVPYSLRELEAMIMGNKFNIITEARFVKENFAVTGNLGKRQGVDYNEVAGSLYQMHKNYNFDVSNPNTVYDEKSTDPNTRVVIDDDDIRSESQKKKGMYRYVNTYGKTAKINANPELFSAQETYLSAAGDWRAVSAYNRIPCLRDEY